ncbi:MAG: GNAT family N-acetyltransferase [Pirellulaceae bacterium]
MNPASHKSDIVFETSRLYASNWEASDLQDAFSMYGDADVTRYMTGAPEPDLEAMEKRLAWLIDRNRSLPAAMGSFPVYTRDRHQLVGAALIKPLPDNDEQPTDDIEIGWHLKKSFWGYGFASEFGRELLRIGFEQLGESFLHAVVDVENDASRRVAERIGMRFCGTTTKYYSGEPILHFQLTAEEFAEQNASN